MWYFAVGCKRVCTDTEMMVVECKRVCSVWYWVMACKRVCIDIGSYSRAVCCKKDRNWWDTTRPENQADGMVSDSLDYKRMIGHIDQCIVVDSIVHSNCRGTLGNQMRNLNSKGTWTDSRSHKILGAEKLVAGMVCYNWMTDKENQLNQTRIPSVARNSPDLVWVCLVFVVSVLFAAGRLTRYHLKYRNILDQPSGRLVTEKFLNVLFFRLSFVWFLW